jgi:hypothetical protein
MMRLSAIATVLGFMLGFSAGQDRVVDEVRSSHTLTGGFVPDFTSPHRSALPPL